MHGGRGFERTWTRAEFFGLAIKNGRAATGAPGTGELVIGAPADFVVLDLDRLDRDAIMDVDPLELLFARGNTSLITQVVVNGRTIVRDGNPAGVDLADVERELRGMYRKNVRQFSSFVEAWPPLEKVLTNLYGAQMGCS
jgi:cytosine/adenosine deaminase-related metal-dependent hydrolase